MELSLKKQGNFTTNTCAMVSLFPNHKEFLEFIHIQSKLIFKKLFQIGKLTEFKILLIKLSIIAVA